jgi:hypothetical protein
MPFKERELKESLKSAIKSLILQEIRLSRLEQTFTPPFVIDEMVRSIQETKRRVIGLVRLLPSKERNTFVKRLIRQSLDEEVDLAFKVRKNRCFRCVHVRYFDDEGTAHLSLPVRIGRAQIIGCEMVSTPSGVRCQEFIESSTATSVEDFFGEITFFYEVKEMFDQFDEIWEEYLIK